MTLADPECREQPEVTPPPRKKHIHLHLLCPTPGVPPRGGLWGLEVPKIQASVMAGPKK